MLLDNQFEVFLSIDSILSNRRIGLTEKGFVSRVEASETSRQNPQSKVAGGAKVSFDATEEMAKALAGKGINKKLRMTIEIVDDE